MWIIGIARAFAYSGSKGILLKDMMNTGAAKRIAEHRHGIMEAYLEEFMAEWEGER